MVDGELFYYGRAELKHSSFLPFEMKPEYWGYNKGMRGFVLLDDYEMSYIGNGVVYRVKPDMEIDSVLSYGYNDHLLVGLVKATDQEKYYILCTGSSPYDTKVLSFENEDLSKEFDDLKWINVRDNELINSKKEERATYFVLGIFFFLLLIIYVVGPILHLKIKKIP